MKEEHVHALQSLRDRIRAVCVHDQAQWDATWKEVLGDLSSSRRVFVPPGVFFEVLDANSVHLGRADTRLLLRRFQEQNGAVAATRFLRWVALNAPADHTNPDLLVPQLPQPYRRIKKVFDRHIFDAAWEIITAESARFKAEGSALAGSSGANHGADRGQTQLHQQKNDYDAAQRRCCEPTWHIPLDSSAQQIGGLASHCLMPLVLAGINNAATGSSAINGPLLRAVSTANGDVRVLGDFAIELPADTQSPERRPGMSTTVHLVIKKLSALQLLNDRQGGVCCCLAVHLIETTTFELVDPEANPDAQPPAPTMRECVNVYAVRPESMQPPSNTEISTRELPWELLTVVRPTRVSLEPSIDSIVLSPDSMYLAVTSFSSAIVALYCLQQDESIQGTEAERQPRLLSAPAFQADLTASRSPFTDDEGDLVVHFLVRPVTLRPQRGAQPPAPPSTYAVAVSYGPKVLKFLLPSNETSNTPLGLTPAKSWEHLTKISASAQDITTQYLAVGCEDGTLVVWDVLQDTDYAFLSPFDDAGPPAEPTQSKPSKISSVVFSPAGYIAALSKSQQRLYFFDVRERGKSTLMRVVSPPSSTNTRQPPSHSTVIMTSLGVSADIPVVLVEFSSGMVMLYDVRSAEAIGSVWSAAPAASPPVTQHPISSTEDSAAMSIVGNQEVLGVATSSTPSMEAAEAGIDLYRWRDLLLAYFPFFENELQQRQEEMTTSNIKQLFLSSDIDSAFAATPPSIVTASGGSSDLLESMFLRMAGELPLSAQQAPRARNSNADALSPQSSLGQSSISNTLGTSAPTSQIDKEGLDQGADSSVMLEPIVPDGTAYFEEYCRQYLDPVVVADKEAKLHRKRRELLKTMSAGGAW
ncbi:hypothetical protein KRP22_006986 [Phytophthora ramorum]|nr:hypothetical protein KRP22_1917 [Phytophthora ramorum]